MVTYKVYDDADSDFLTSADLGTSADHVAGSGSTSTGLSGYMLDTSGASASQAGWKVIRKLPLPDNNYGSAAGSQVQMEVSLNESFFGQFTAGI